MDRDYHTAVGAEFQDRWDEAEDQEETGLSWEEIAWNLQEDQGDRQREEDAAEPEAAE